LLVKIAETFHHDHSLGTIDVIVSDLRMPVCSGLELFEKLAEAGWGVAFVLMTAFGDDDTRARARRIGATLFDKPLSLEALRTEVRRLVASR
jgi:DNA-binding NtrC family response regulator